MEAISICRMNKAEKKIEIDKLLSQINDLKFKIDAIPLKVKFSKNIGFTMSYAFESIGYAMQIKMLHSQIQTIQAIPNFPKGGIAMVGNSERKEIIISK